MPSTFTTDDVKILGYREVASRKNVPGYEVIDATSVMGIEERIHRFIYLKANCTIELATQVANDWVDPERNVYLVTANSLDIVRETLVRIFGKDTILYSHGELVWKVFRSSFDDYLEHLRLDVPKDEDFIGPRLESSRNEDNVVHQLTDYLSGRSDVKDNGTLQVLSADAGVGKTTLSRKLIHELVRTANTTKTIPIYVEAQHWRKLNMGSLEALWDVIENSLRILAEPQIKLTDELFKHALRQAYFCFIFDGFDELCVEKGGQFDALSVIDELNDVVEESEARVLLTTRTNFWDNNIGVEIPSKVRVLKLVPFNTQETKKYFNNVFGQSGPKRAAADNLHSKLLHQAQPRENKGSVRFQFVNLPLCVRMVADYVKRGGTTVYTDVNTPVLGSFLTEICNREIIRQELLTSAAAQMNSFKDMALNFDEVNPVFNIEDLCLTPDGFDVDDREKLSDHALVSRFQYGNSEEYCFRYEFIATFLRSLEIFHWIREETSTIETIQAALVEVMERESDGRGQLLEHLLNLLDDSDIERLLSIGKDIATTERRKFLESFFFQAAQAIVSDISGIQRTERSRLLLRHMTKDNVINDDIKVIGWRFRGLITGLDLRDVVFDRCQFSNVNFRNCLTNQSTRFMECKFDDDLNIEGGLAGWRTATFDKNCSFSVTADVKLESLIDKTIGKRNDRILRILNLGLRKFWHNGRVRREISVSVWKRGPLSKTKREAQLLHEAMLKVGLVTNSPKGSKEPTILLDQKSIGDVGNYMDNNQLSGKVDELYKVMLSSENKVRV